MQTGYQEAADRHRDRVYTFASYCLGDREEAEDVTQEVLIRLWRNWEKVEQERVVPWLIHVTRNACIDAIRRRKAYRAVVAQDSDGIQAARVPGRSPDPSQAAESADFRDRLEAALRVMAEPYRTIVILREIQDLRYEEITAALDMPLNTVKVYLHRGRRKLRDALKEYVKHDSA